MGRYSRLEKILNWEIYPITVLLMMKFLSGMTIPLGIGPLITRKDISKKIIEIIDKSIRNINPPFSNSLTIARRFFVRYRLRSQGRI